MKKNIFILILALFSFSAIHAEGDTNVKALPLSLTDNDSYANVSQIDGVDVSYTRNFTNVNWQAIYLPFSFTYEDVKDDFELAYINAVHQNDIDGDGEIDETLIEVIKIKSGSTVPNKPYLIRAKTTGVKTISVENATVYAAEEESVDCSTTIAKFTFTGNYSTVSYETMSKNKYYTMVGGEQDYTLVGGQLGFIGDDSGLKPFRWYMKAESRNSRYNTSNAARAITVSVIDEEATGISQSRRQ